MLWNIFWQIFCTIFICLFMNVKEREVFILPCSCLQPAEFLSTINVCNIFRWIFCAILICLSLNVKERELTIAAGWISFHWPQSEPLIGHCPNSATRNCLFTEKSNYHPPVLGHSHLSLLRRFSLLCKRYFHGYFEWNICMNTLSHEWLDHPHVLAIVPFAEHNKDLCSQIVHKSQYR